MREFEFTVRYEPGRDDLMDLFVENPGLKAKTKACFANEQSMWRIDHAFGPEAAIEAFDAVYLDEATCNECLDVEGCESTRNHQVLDRGPEHRLVYTRRRAIDRCHSIPTLAAEHVGDGVLFEAERRGAEYVWRLLMPGEARIGELYDAIGRKLRGGLALEVGHVTQKTDWNTQSTVAGSLTAAEREAVETAVAEGYYATPRGTTVADLGRELDVPTSTVQYRLQRAEEKIFEHFVAESL